MGKLKSKPANKYKLPPPVKHEAARYEALTIRDEDIAWDIYLNKVLTVPQIHRMHFPDVAPGDGSPVSRRLRILRELGQVQVMKRRGEPRRHYYIAGPEYIRLAAQDSGRHAGYLYRHHLREVKETLAVDHRLMLNDVFSFFRREENFGKGELADWLPEPGTRFVFKHAGKERSLIPDAKGIWASNQAGRCTHFLVEVDRGTMRLDLIREKFERYLALLLRLGFARVGDQPVFPVVLVIARTARRAESLADCVKAATVQIGLRVDDARRFIVFAFSDLTTIERSGILGDVWRVPLEVTSNRKTFEELLPSNHLCEGLGLHFRVYDKKWMRKMVSLA